MRTQALLGPVPRAEGEGRISPGVSDATCPTFPQMLYQNDLHPTPTLHLTSKNWIEVAVPEDIGYALVQIRTTGPGGDGTPAEVHIVRNGGAASPHPFPPGVSGSTQIPDEGIFPAQGNPSPARPQGERGRQAGAKCKVVLEVPWPPPPDPHPSESWGGERAPLRGPGGG